MTYLAITVLATIMLYYELYVGGSVSTLFLAKFHMSFTFLVYTLAVGNLIGAFGSLFAGLTDRLGRTNLVVAGLIITAVFVAFIIPAAPNKWAFTIEGWIVAVVEGICLVATPALIRDFSPQVGRASAMGFWTSGPVLGSVVVFVVASHTIGGNPSPAFWTHEYHICGIAGLVVAAIALIGLRELSPGLRDQLMVTMHDRALIEAKAKGIDIEASLRNPWGQLLKADVLVSALGISVFLLIYYTAVGFGLILFTTVFGFSVHDGDALGNWNWIPNAIAVVTIGFVSDRFRVRKPFMMIGGIAAAVMMVIYLEQIGNHPSYYSLAIILAASSVTLGIAYVPWMASFTETVEARNPALTATGLAIWGWTIRVIVFVSYMILPSVINTVTPLVQYGGEVQALVTKYPAATLPPSLLAGLAQNPTPARLAEAHQLLGPNYLQELIALKNAPASDLAYLQAHGPKVASAAAHTGAQWKNWFWICFGCMIFFLLTVPLMRGRWSPKQARADEEAHEAMVQAELAKLGTTATA
ncbi:MAG TPA: MFS transporter [Acidimicrobiales bacterium]|nr:MFS transporter [Acidimicrobiales bacterium]